METPLQADILTELFCGQRISSVIYCPLRPILPFPSDLQWVEQCPPKRYISLFPGPGNVTLFRNKVFAGTTMLRWGHTALGGAGVVTWGKFRDTMIHREGKTMQCQQRARASQGVPKIAGNLHKLEEARRFLPSALWGSRPLQALCLLASLRGSTFP